MFRNRKNKAQRATSGQSTVEYIVLVTAVIATVIFFVAPGKDGQGKFQKKIVTVMNDTSEAFVSKSDTLDTSHADTVNYVAPQQTVNLKVKTSLFDR